MKLVTDVKDIKCEVGASFRLEELRSLMKWCDKTLKEIDTDKDMLLDIQRGMKSVFMFVKFELETRIKNLEWTEK